VRCMEQALSTVCERAPVTYINAHGTSTPIGDITELDAIREVFKKRDQDVPAISATKSMTGHSLGATGVQEAIYCLLMLGHNFIAPSINIETLDEGAKGLPIAQQRIDNVRHQTLISNSFGFGGTNCTLAFSRFEG
jgi:3-oxoacyl-[acyl-carrier-protein] synthase-1